MAQRAVGKRTASRDGRRFRLDRIEDLEGRLLLSGAVVEFSLPEGFYPGAIAATPDGNLWVAGLTGLGKVSPQGAFTPFVPKAGSDPVATYPTALTTDARGNVWFLGSNPREVSALPPGVSSPLRPTFPGAPPVVGPQTIYPEVIGRIAPDGTVTDFPIPDYALSIPSPYYSAEKETFALAAGPDGNIWYVGGSKIGRLSPDGSVAEFALPAPTEPTVNGQAPTPRGALAIAAGPDGNLWFTDTYQYTRFGGYETHGPGPANGFGPPLEDCRYQNCPIYQQVPVSEIGRITPSGAIVVYASSNTPAALTGGPDGAVWFTQNSTRTLGRIAPDGTIASVPAQLPNDGRNISLTGITTGPDGNLWSTGLFGNIITRVSPSGTYTEYALPTANSQPLGIVTGADGNIWFTELGSSKVGRVLLNVPPSAGGPAPVPFVMALRPGSDTGPSNTDGITNVNRPNFRGTAPPGSTIRAFAQASGQTSALLVGQTEAGPDGTWSLVAGPLADGSYAFSLVESDVPSQPLTTTALTLGYPLVIDTAAPRIVAETTRLCKGQLIVKLQDGLSGLDRRTLDDPALYTLVVGSGRSSRIIHATRVTIRSADPASPTAAETLVISFHRGRGLRPVRHLGFRVQQGGMSDRAGNSAQGTYRLRRPAHR